MTLRTISRISQTCAVAMVASGLCVAEDATQKVAYVEGTVQEIPVKTAGSLDVGDSQNLHFRFGETDYSIPSSQITDYRWRKEADGFGDQVAGGASKVGRTLLPMFFDKTKFLTINFKDPEKDATEQLVFEIPKSMVATTDPVLEKWIEKNQADQAVDPEESWWGNRYWRTHRNRHLWEADKKEAK